MTSAVLLSLPRWRDASKNTVMSSHKRIARTILGARHWQQHSHSSTQAQVNMEDSNAPVYVQDLLSYNAHGTRAANPPASQTRPTAMFQSHQENGQEDRQPYWQKIWRWRDVPEEKFLSHVWQNGNSIRKDEQLYNFLGQVLPETIPPSGKGFSKVKTTQTSEGFIADVFEGIKNASMALAVTPHIMSVIDWNKPYDDPIRRQFIPLQSEKEADHPALKLDSLGEKDSERVDGVVHRYPSKVLFLTTTVCPVYCRYCTRSYAIGPKTGTTEKKSVKPTQTHIDQGLEYIRQHPEIHDVVVSGGDSYTLSSTMLRHVGESLLAMPHIKRFRIATKGIAVNPSRIVNEWDTPSTWTHTLIDLSNQGRQMGKEVAVHTHFNHPNEITWVSRLAARILFREGVRVRNQTVLLRGVNDDVGTMSSLINGLADMSIEPYYVYLCDMVKGTEDLRTPLSTILHLQKQLQGTIGGHYLPRFIVDLPGGGGKKIAHGFESYENGVSKWTSPVIDPDRIYTYHDPLRSTR